MYFLLLTIILVIVFLFGTHSGAIPLSSLSPGYKSSGGLKHQCSLWMCSSNSLVIAEVISRSPYPRDEALKKSTFSVEYIFAENLAQFLLKYMHFKELQTCVKFGKFWELSLIKNLWTLIDIYSVLLIFPVLPSLPHPPSSDLEQFFLYYWTTSSRNSSRSVKHCTAIAKGIYKCLCFFHQWLE